MRIGITYNLKGDVLSVPHQALPQDIAEEFDSPETIEAIQNVLSKEGHEVHLLGADSSVSEKVKRFGIEFVFNLAEGFHGRDRESQIPALLERLKIPYSGSDPLGLSITLDKSLAKRIAISLGIKTPEFWVINQKDDSKTVPNQFPLFVKPLWQGSSMGIKNSSHVKNRTQLEQETNRLFEHYPGDPVLVEAYIPGREFTVGVVGNQPPEVLGIMEISFVDPNRKDFCYSLEVKRNWKELVEYQCPAKVSPTSEKEIRDATVKLFNALRLRDVARFDFRMNPEGKI